MVSEVFNKDCFEAMKEYPDNYFDLCVADPPYGIGVQTMNYTSSGAVRPSRKSATKRRDYRCTGEWDKKPNKAVFDEMMRVSKSQIIWGGTTLVIIFPQVKVSSFGIKEC